MIECYANQFLKARISMYIGSAMSYGNPRFLSFIIIIIIFFLEKASFLIIVF